MAAEPMENPKVVMEEAVYQDGLRRMKLLKIYKPRAWKWLNAKHASNKSLAKVIDRDETFYFRPYVYTAKGITRAQLFEEQNEKTNLVPWESCPPKPQSLLTIITPTILRANYSQGRVLWIRYDP